MIINCNTDYKPMNIMINTDFEGSYQTEPLNIELSFNAITLNIRSKTPVMVYRTKNYQVYYYVSAENESTITCDIKFYKQSFTLKVEAIIEKNGEIFILFNNQAYYKLNTVISKGGTKYDVSIAGIDSSDVEIATQKAYYNNTLIATALKDTTTVAAIKASKDIEFLIRTKYEGHKGFIIIGEHEFLGRGLMDLQYKKGKEFKVFNNDVIYMIDNHQVNFLINDSTITTKMLYDLFCENYRR